MQQVGVWVPSHELVAREGVQVYGPDAGGDLDLVAGEPTGRIVPIRLRDGEHHNPGHSYNGPADLGPAGEETLSVLVMSRELVTGLHKFAARPFDRQTGEPASNPANEYEIFINTAPQDVRAVRCVEEMQGGRLRFKYGKKA